MSSEDSNLVNEWIKIDIPRWVAGILAGMFAGLLSIAAAGVFAQMGGHEFTYPMKLLATPLLGAEATEYTSSFSIVLGLMGHLAICAFWGFIYAHFTPTNALSALLGVGITFGTFSWIFTNNLFSKSFRDVYVADVPSGVAFAICLVYGVGLVSVAFFDRIVRGRAY